MEFDRILAKYVAGQVIRNLAGNDVLSLGCGRGLTEEWLAKHGCSLTLLDKSQECISEAAERVGSDNVYVASIEELDRFSPRITYTDILMASILEHVDDPVQCLKIARGHLKEGGRIHVVVPNSESLHRLIGVGMGLLEDTQSFSDRDRSLEHKRVYNIGALCHDILAAGLHPTTFSRGIFLKPMSNSQMLAMPEAYWDACNAMSERFPLHCALLYVWCTE